MWLLRPYDNLNQPDAKSMCRKRGGNLLTIRNNQDTERLKSIVLSFAKGSSVNLWIGLQRCYCAYTIYDDWKWITTGQAPSYKNWYNTAIPDGQPYAYTSFNGVDTSGAEVKIPDGAWLTGVNTFTAGAACQIGEFKQEFEKQKWILFPRLSEVDIVVR